MKISKEAKIGIFALITIALLIWGVNFLKGKNIFKPKDTYYSVYDNIDGLIESGIIYLKGYKIGTVSSLKFDSRGNGKIVVEFSVLSQVQIPKNSVFQIYTSSIVSGIKDVRLLFSNETEYYESGDTVPGSLDMGLASIIDPVKIQVLSTVEKLDTTLARISNLLDAESVSDLKSTFNHLNGISETLDNGKLDKTLDNIKIFTDSLSKSSSQLKNLISNFEQFSDSLSDSQFKSAINKANESLANAAGILEKINAGEGTMGMLIHNDSLYINLQEASKNLDILLADLKAHPKRYVHFSVFGKKEKE